MLSLVRSQDSTVQKKSLIDNYCQWETNNKHGCYFHQRKNFKDAITYFELSVSISHQIKESFPEQPHQKSGLEMLYISSHNLAACYNAEGQCTKATETLEELHRCLMNISFNQYKPRKLRLEALANLDKSLFSFSSQLAYMNRLKDIHAVIMQTECIAASVSSELLEQHSPL